MPYVGNPLADAYSARQKQDLTGQSGTSFTLTHSVSSPNDLSVYINHVRQEPTTAYTVNGTALTTTGSVAGTDDFYIIYDELAIQSISHPTNQALTATAGTFTSGLVGTTGTFSGALSGTTGTFSGALSAKGGAVFNEDSADVDFRVESDNRTHALFVDGAGGNIGIDATPKNWNSSWTAADIGDQGAVTHYDGGDTNIVQNAYHDGAWKAKETGYSSRIAIGNEYHIHYFTGTVSADASTTMTEVARFTDAGLHLGGTGDANAINDYEEGTWTPRLHGTTTGDGTAASRIDANGAYDYYKIGKLVFVNWYFSAQSTSTQMTGNLTLGGLPFTSNGNYMMNGSVTYNMGVPGDVDGYYLRGSTAGNTVITFLQPRDGQSWLSIDAADSVPNATSIYFQGSLTYATDS